MESGERVVIGVNRHRSDPEPIEVFRIDPAGEQRQVGRRSGRCASGATAPRWRRRSSASANAAGAGENVMPACIEAVKAYATVGEIVGVIRTVHGGWREAAAR